MVNFETSMAKIPAIKGIFINGHIKALREQAGEDAVAELERRFGRKLKFGNLEDVPVWDEVALLGHMVDMKSDGTLRGAEREEAAGRLHYQNFVKTSLGGTLMNALPHSTGSFVTLLKNVHSIGRTVFSNTDFRCQERSGGLRVTITNCGYPLEHFKGFFEAWMSDWELEGASVEASVRSEGTYEYDLGFAK